jgi:hypothetical protein
MLDNPLHLLRNCEQSICHSHLSRPQSSAHRGGSGEDLRRGVRPQFFWLPRLGCQSTASVHDPPRALVVHVSVPVPILASPAEDDPTPERTLEDIGGVAIYAPWGTEVHALQRGQRLFDEHGLPSVRVNGHIIHSANAVGSRHWLIRTSNRRPKARHNLCDNPPESTRPQL